MKIGCCTDISLLNRTAYTISQFVPVSCQSPLSLPSAYEPKFGPSFVTETARVLDQTGLAQHTYRVRLHAPEIARRIVPGQFLMVRLPDRHDPLLARPFALYDICVDSLGEPYGIEFVYHVVGKATTLLSQLANEDTLEIWGPLGNGFPAPTGGRLFCMGGGIGYTPFLAVAREALCLRRYGPTRKPPRTDVTLCYGVRSKSDRADLSDFHNLGRDMDIQIATDDGTEGHAGYVTDLLKQAWQSGSPPDRVYVCGPEPMMRAAATICFAAKIPCWVSLETPMACGFGVCFSCVTKIVVDTEPGWDYRRTCIEGPVFSASELVW